VGSDSMTASVANANTGTPSYSMASLYVGDLHPDVTESMLFEKFSTAGSVLSIRVCRDNASRLSLGYAYVNFQQPTDAERALDTMNFDILHGRPMRIMWSQRDPAVRRSGTGNIFIKNLDKVIDNKSIYDTFSLFGNILSCKVAVDDEGNSKGYGFVHFETDEAAQNAINKVNGMLLAGKKVYVGKFQPRSQRMREMGESTKKFTNVFIKNFGESLDKEGLQKLFEPFGQITSCAVMTDAEGKSKGFGFVAYEQPEQAEKAVQEMNDYVIEGTEYKLVVCRAQKKSERNAELKRKHDLQKVERMQRYQGVNLYVKNLDDTVDDETLRKHFESYGKITSCKVMTDENGRSKGFGFVCFEKPDEATNAVTEMNSKMVCSKPLYVALAQRKEDRRAQLASQYMQRLASMRLSNNVPGTMYTPSQGGYFVSSTLQNQRGFAPNAMPGTAMRSTARNWQTNFGGQNPYIVPGGPVFQGRGRAGVGTTDVRSQQFTSSALQAGNRLTGQRAVAAGVAGQGQGAGQRQHPGQRPQATGGKQGAAPLFQQYQQNQQQRPHINQGIVVGGQEPLTSHMLAQAAPQEQKQLLGERIYALIDRLYPGHKDAGKITGMMLEIDNSELIMMLQDMDLFKSKVEEASSVLHKASAATYSYLLATSDFALHNGLPTCLASAWSSRANDVSCLERISDGTRCLRCGINLRNRRSFDLKIKEADITLTIKGICCGCKQEYYCGEMERPSYSDQSTVDTEYVSYTSTSLDRTFDERGIRASSTPLQKHAMSPVISSRASKLDVKSKRMRKQRGSALERLLKEEESEADRSLSGFLKMVAKY
ncbi:hypothetical protein Angca_005920, partial [Angiostrongylus cantonensis]